MNRRVLIISPHFPPVNAPDHQRVRMMLSHLNQFGWEGHVLAFNPETVEGARDMDLLSTIPSNVPVTLVDAIPYKYTRPFGFGNLIWRGLRPFRRAAEKLLRAEKFDVVFFSTTIFGVLHLGPLFKRKYRLPYVVDFQDPWVSEYYKNSGVRPPGGKIRYAISSYSARKSEPNVVREAAHIIAVSPAYPADMSRRYPDVSPNRFTVLPFASAPRDFEVVRERNIRHSIFDSGDSFRHWVYLGRGGSDMAKALRYLFGAIRQLRAANHEIENLKMHFVGTSYAPAPLAKETIMPIARECGVIDLVDEQTSRLPYMQGLDLLQSADTVIVVGSDDPGYSASKVYPCVASGRPVLGIMHRESSAGRVIEDCNAGDVVRFDSDSANEGTITALRNILLRKFSHPKMAPCNTDWDAFQPYTALAMTHKICDVFNLSISEYQHT